MYLKFIRHKQPCGQINRGSLYSVHFQPTEKGGYTEHLTHISDAYEIAAADQFALALIYPAGVPQKHGRMRLTFGAGIHRSMLHLIDHDVREGFLSQLADAIRRGEEVRIELGIKN